MAEAPATEIPERPRRKNVPSYIVEPDRERRARKRFGLIDAYKGETLPEGKLPAMVVYAWLRAPDSRRHPFLCSKDELHREFIATRGYFRPE